MESTTTTTDKRCDLHDLISRHGLPPPELCLDWAWQIERLQRSPGLTAVAWQQLAIDEQGQLYFVEPDHVEPDHVELDRASSEQGRPASELIRQLRDWADRAHESGGAARACTTSRWLHERTLDYIRSTERTPQPAPPWQPAEQKPFADVANAGSTPSKPGPADPRGAASLRQPANKGVVRGKPWRWGVAGAALLLLVVAVFSAFRLSSDRAARTAEQQVAGDALTSAKQAPGGSSLSVTTASSSDEATAGDDGLSLPQLALSEPVVPSELEGAMRTRGSPDATLAELVSGRMELPRLAELGSPTGGSAVTPPRMKTPGDNAGHNSGATADGLPRMPGQQLPGASLSQGGEPGLLADHDIDLLAEIHQLNPAESVDNPPTEVGGSEADQPQPAWILPTSPMLQTQRMSIRLAIPVRQPAWELSVDAGEELVVEPAGPQWLSGKQLVTWTVRDSEAAAPATRVVIGAQLGSGRIPAIRWRIFATAEDLPQLMAPLGESQLLALQHMLGQWTQRMQLSIDAMQTAAKARGLTSELRTVLSSRRREGEQQLAVAARVREILADAQQIEAWLDGQLLVHARLFDWHQTDSPALLQFGEPNSTAAAAAALQPDVKPSAEGLPAADASP